MFVTPPMEPVVFNLTEQVEMFLEHFNYVVTWSKSHFVQIGINSFSFYDLFFSAWAVFLVCSWIPVLSDFFIDGGDEDYEDDPGYIWYE